MGVLTDWQIERDVQITPFSPAQKRDGVISYGCTSYGYDVRLGYTFRVFDPYPPGEMVNVIDPKNFNPKMLRHVDLTPKTHSYVEDELLPGRWRCKHCGKPTKDKRWAESRVYPKDITCPTPDHIIIPPNSFVLGESLEEFRFPRDINCLVVGKSTYARCGLIVNVTPGEPDWQGRWTIELSNTTPLPMKVYCGEGIMQCVFLRSDARYELALAALADYLDVPNPPVQEGWAPPTKEEAANYLRQLVLREGPIFKEATCRQSYADKKGKYQGQGGLTLPAVDKVAPAPAPTPDGADLPPANATGDFWKSPRGSIWRRRSPDHPWVEVSGPAPKTRSDIR